MTPADVRALFPSLDTHVWLNAAAASPLCRPVHAAMQAHLDETLASGDLGVPRWLRFKEEVRARLARFLGATAPEVAFTPSTSFGFHVVAQMLKARGVTEVLTLETEFPSTTLPLLYDGLAVRAVRRRPDGTYPVEDLEAALTPRTGAVAVSAVQFASGYRLDLEAVGRLCRERGLTFVLNAAQGLGHVPIDVQRLGVSFLAATSHKWLFAGWGVGVLYVARPWLEAVPLPMAGWLSVTAEEQFSTWANAARTPDAAGVTARGLRIRQEASALEVGGGAWAGLYALDAALALHEAVGVETTLAHDVALQQQLRAGLRRRGFAPTTPDDPATMSGCCVVPVQGDPLDAVRALLREARVVTTPRGGGVRLSTHVFNTGEDVERGLAAIDRLGLRPA